MEHARSMSINSAISAVEVEEERPVRCAKFRRQELWAYKPVWSPTLVAIMYLVMAFILIPLGIVVFTQSMRLMRTPQLRYDNARNSNHDCRAEIRLNMSSPAAEAPTCVIKIEIPRSAKAGKVFMYYGLTNFFQNARRYVPSRSDDQLRGFPKPDTGDCKHDANKTTPCGLTSRSHFNDSFELCHDSNCSQPVNMSSKNIAWAVDRNVLFKSSSSNTAAQNDLITSEDFMVWMRLAPYNQWFKLYRRIEDDIKNGTYFVRINSVYPVEQFDGQKFIYLAETTWFGGPNRFLGLACIVVGALSLLLAIIYWVRSRFAPTPELPPETSVPWIDPKIDGSTGS